MARTKIFTNKDFLIYGIKHFFLFISCFISTSMHNNDIIILVSLIMAPACSISISINKLCENGLKQQNANYRGWCGGGGWSEMGGSWPGCSQATHFHLLLCIQYYRTGYGVPLLASQPPIVLQYRLILPATHITRFLISPWITCNLYWPLLTRLTVQF